MYATNGRDIEVLAVVGCVAAVCSAYHDGAELVQHIKEKRKARKALKQAPQVDETTQELEQSLSRGEGTVRTQYDRDFKRFGESFANGDPTDVARDALKDIIIHLQQQVISNLKIHWEQDTFVDFAALQDVSDSSQDRCILVLMQLQQRIITSGPIENLTPPPLNVVHAYNQRPLPPGISNYVYTSPSDPTSDPTLRTVVEPTFHAPSQHEQGFAFAAIPPTQNAGPLTPPHSPFQPPGSFVQSHTVQHHLPVQAHSLEYPPLTPYAQSRPIPYPATGPHVQPSGVHYAASQASVSQNSLTHAASAQYPQLSPYAQATKSPYLDPHGSAVHQCQSPIHGAQASTGEQRSRSKSSPECDSPNNRTGSSTGQYKPIATTIEKVSFFGIRKKKVERVTEPPENPLIDQYLAAAMEDEHKGVIRTGSIRGSTSTTRSSGYEATPPNVEPRRGDSNSITDHDSTTKELSPSRPRSNGRLRSSFDLFMRTPTHHSAAHDEVFSSNCSITSIHPKDLLPSELNKYAGFCKGAWRQQIGDRKKAIEERLRPGGMYNATKYLQCKQCRFEGRLVPANKKNGFDMRVFKIVEGIQFRWEFLFKSHIPTKNAVPGPTNGAFGCIFCCTDGKGTPTFEGVVNFMGHLAEHRDRLPTGEVLYRMNCLVGRQAGIDEDFDINIISKEGVAF
ncbi:MAG: hypothetical protein Q9163_000429 [Psora crenata]